MVQVHPGPPLVSMAYRVLPQKPSTHSPTHPLLHRIRTDSQRHQIFPLCRPCFIDPFRIAPEFKHRMAARTQVATTRRSLGEAPMKIRARFGGLAALSGLHHRCYRCYCRYAAESSSASKRQSQQGACVAKVEPRATRHERCRVTIADVAEKIRFHMSFREKLLHGGLIFASRKELLIEFCVIKA